jgi:hypothetical protein
MSLSNDIVKGAAYRAGYQLVPAPKWGPPTQGAGADRSSSR